MKGMENEAAQPPALRRSAITLPAIAAVYNCALTGLAGDYIILLEQRKEPKPMAGRARHRLPGLANEEF